MRQQHLLAQSQAGYVENVIGNLQIKLFWLILPICLVFVHGHICLYHVCTKNKPHIIGATCTFDAKIYKIVGGVFAVSALLVWSKKFWLFSFLLPTTNDFGRILSQILPLLTK